MFASVAAPLCDHAHMVDEVGNGGQSETPPGMERWVLLRSGFARAQLRDQALVLSARGIRHRLLWREARWWLAVPEAQGELASAELGEYARENVPVPRVAPPPKIDSGVVGVVAYLVAIWAVWLLDVNGAFGWDWRSAGRLHVASIADGEVWRVLTALTLHADLGHIAANSLFGAVFGVFAGRCLGSGLAWAAIVLAAAVGNALNAFVQPESFQSIGASTATFAAVGLVAAFVWRTGYYRQFGWRKGLAPVFAAVALFAFTGVGGERTDIVGHLMGLVSGFVAGLALARLGLERAGRDAQRFFGLAALASIVIAWVVASA